MGTFLEDYLKRLNIKMEETEEGRQVQEMLKIIKHQEDPIENFEAQPPTSPPELSQKVEPQPQTDSTPE